MINMFYGEKHTANKHSKCCMMVAAETTKVNNTYRIVHDQTPLKK